MWDVCLVFSQGSLVDYLRKCDVRFSEVVHGETGSLGNIFVSKRVHRIKVWAEELKFCAVCV